MLAMCRKDEEEDQDVSGETMQAGKSEECQLELDNVDHATANSTEQSYCNGPVDEDCQGTHSMKYTTWSRIRILTSINPLKPAETFQYSVAL